MQYLVIAIIYSAQPLRSRRADPRSCQALLAIECAWKQDVVLEMDVLV